MIHEFLPPNFYEAILQASHWPSDVKAASPDPRFDRHLANPWQDPIVDSYILTRFALLREYRARDAESHALFWRHATRSAEVLAEAEREILADMYEIVTQLEHEYIARTYLDREMEKFDETKLLKRIAKHRHDDEPEDNSQANRIKERFGITRYMIPPDFAGHIGYNAMLVGAQKDTNSPLLVTPIRDTTRKYVAGWAGSTSYLHSEIMMSSRLMFQDMIRNGKRKNSLVGPSSKSKHLLTNGNIPVPDLVTILGWHGLVGFDWSDLSWTGRVSLAGIVGHKPESIITFGIPLLPMTREQQGGFGAAIAQEDAHSNHSLSARNPAHNRDEYGRINHGYYLVTTATIGGGPSTILVQSQVRGADVRVEAILAEHYNVLPHSAIAGRTHKLTGKLSALSRLGLLGMLSDPWKASAQESVLPYEWPTLRKYPHDTPFRCLARWYGMMFRFDEIAQVNNWIAAYLVAAEQWAATNRNERMVAYFDESLRNWVENEPHIVSPKAGKGRFDFGILDDSND